MFLVPSEELKIEKKNKASKKINKARKINKASKVRLGSRSHSKGTAAVRESHLHPRRCHRSLPARPRLGNKAGAMLSALGEGAGAARSARLPPGHPSHAGAQQKASAPAGKGPPLPWQPSGRLCTGETPGSYLLHDHCFIAEIRLRWGLGCVIHPLLIHQLRAALKREGKPCGDALVAAVVRNPGAELAHARLLNK